MFPSLTLHTLDMCSEGQSEKVSISQSYVVRDPSCTKDNKWHHLKVKTVTCESLCPAFSPYSLSRAAKAAFISLSLGLASSILSTSTLWVGLSEGLACLASFSVGEPEFPRECFSPVVILISHAALKSAGARPVARNIRRAVTSKFENEPLDREALGE